MCNLNSKCETMCKGAICNYVISYQPQVILCKCDIYFIYLSILIIKVS